MYQFAYAEIQSDSVADAKDRERQILTRSIDMLIAAKEKGPLSIEAVQAIHFLNRVWTTFIEDLGSEENGLPQELRANLISIGLWLLREAEEIRQGRSSNFEGLIEVSQIIRDGIQ
ncbi:flagellar biosynthesis regulator FlaF [Aquamicrobium zhengzhouense]|uniref:Flagellar biosynthesis regulator FlaF n=1 Tax=Aquamicrobium zhengzhouense TaxID=2781738 RepID=A0ABS0S8W4_9HYPH|nr:flagellar biosynthesis regulator FlaF [Aquamicrobium zhengzhouense]MBI1619729.1 flagellar biosynthesis regulator FlaF [Aquamicrobium zhengzhouense]